MYIYYRVNIYYRVYTPIYYRMSILQGVYILYILEGMYFLYITGCVYVIYYRVCISYILQGVYNLIFHKLSPPLSGSPAPEPSAEPLSLVIDPSWRKYARVGNLRSTQSLIVPCKHTRSAYYLAFKSFKPLEISTIDFQATIFSSYSNKQKFSRIICLNICFQNL